MSLISSFRSGKRKAEEELQRDEGDSSARASRKAPREECGLFPFADPSKDPSEENDYTVDIVAVHGLGGDWEATWTDRNGRLWLRDFLPSQIPPARIMSYGYNSKTIFTSAVTDITDEAAMLLDRLDKERESEEQRTKPILFIAHSLGGIVVKKALILAHERSKHYAGLLECVKGCLFLGVPHRGADIAYWGKLAADLVNIPQLGFGGNTNFLNALKSNSLTLADISQQFIERSSQIKIRTFWETEKIGNQLIVSKDSARLNIDNEIAVGMANANHVDMCKFADTASQKYSPVWRALKRLIDSAVPAKTSSPVPRG